MALSKIIPDSLTDNARGMGGKFLHKITISNDATVAFGSTYITDTYDYYDVFIHDIIPESDAKYLRCRFGVGGSVSTGGSDYAYSIYQIGSKTTDSSEFNANIDGTSNAMLLTSASGIGELGKSGSNGEVHNAHYRFYHLRSTTNYKGMTHMDAFGFSNSEYHVTTRKGLNFGAYNINRTSKVDTIQFSMESGNLASGSMLLYGWKK